MKKKISVLLSGIPEYEILYAIVHRLHERGFIEPICLTPYSVLVREPRLKSLIANSGIKFVVRPNKWFKFFPKLSLSDVSAVICLTDPFYDNGPTKRRSKAIVDLSLPAIFIQHGVIQLDVNYQYNPSVIHYYSDLIILFEKPSQESIFDLDTRNKVTSVGFLKTRLFPAKRDFPLSRQHKLILFCHSFRWADRYTGEEISKFYSMIDQFSKIHPDYQIIVRGHRGKRSVAHKQLDQALTANPNVIISEEKNGPLAGMSLLDILSYTDICVATVSTAVLDSLYLGVPTAIYKKDQPVFPHVPEVKDLTSLLTFCSQAEDHTSAYAQTLEYYGIVRTNIERACDAIESFVAKLG